MAARALIVSCLVVLLGGCNGAGLIKQFEYDEEIYLEINGAATVIINSSIPALMALHGLPLRLVSQAGSRRNITFVLRDADATQAMNHLHDELFAARVPS